MIEPVDPYEAYLKNCQLGQISISTSLRLAHFFKKFSEHFIYHIKLPGMHPNYEKQLRFLLSSFVYRQKTVQNFVCAKKITKYYRCNDCQKMSGLRQVACFCELCFIKGNHTNHNFRLISNADAVCDCGNQDIFDAKCFCKQHKGQSMQPTMDLPHKDESIFCLQYTFLIQLLYELNSIKNDVRDECHKKEIYALILVRRLHEFLQIGYMNQIIFANFLKSKHPYKPEENMLSLLLFDLQKCGCFVQKFCTDVLLAFSGLQQMQQVVLHSLFTKISSSNTFLNGSHPLYRLSFQYLPSFEVTRMLSKGTLPPLVINFTDFTFFQDKFLAYGKLYKVYDNLLQHREVQKILFIMFSKTNSCKLFDYVSQTKEAKRYSYIVTELDDMYVKLLLKLVKIMGSFPLKSSFFKKIIKETYSYIKAKRPTISLSAERTFALALFVYLDYEPDRLYDMEEEQVMDLFDEKDEEATAENLYEMLNKYLYLLSSDIFSDYWREIVKSKDTKGFTKVAAGVDCIYVRFLLMLLIKIDKPYYGAPLAPIQHFVKKRQKTLKQLYEIFENDEKTKMQETIMTYIFQINLLMSFSIYIGESSICETIVASYLGKGDKEDIYDVYKMLVFMDSSVTPQMFKITAEKYLKDDKLIQKFIKEELAVYKQAIKNGEIPKNKFNLSYSSFFVTPTNYNEFNNLYFLKLRNRQRTQFSRLLFSNQTINIFLNIESWFCEAYQNLFKENEVIYTSHISLVVLQTLLILYLQTLNIKVKTMIENIISKRLFQKTGMNERYKDIVNLYKTNEEKLERQRQVVELSRQRMQRSQSLNLKKMQKIKQLRMTQAAVLSSLNSIVTTQESKNLVSNEFELNCIVCHRPSSTNKPLFYLCQYRYSNLLSFNIFKQNFPIITITTCGHPIHNECLELRDDHHFHQLQCMLCKSRANIKILVASRANFTTFSLDNLKQAELILGLGVHKLEAVIRVYNGKINFLSRLVISIVYQLYGYTLFYPKYFMKKVLPIMRQLLVGLKAVKSQIEWSLIMVHFSQKCHNFLLAKIAACLEFTIKHPNSYDKQQKDFILIEALVAYERNHQINLGQSILPKKENHIEVLLATFDALFDHKKQAQAMLRLQQAFQLKPEQQQIGFYKLPQDLYQLNREIGKCPRCHLYTNKILICLLCSHKFCLSCPHQGYLHQDSHFGQGVYLRVDTGIVYYQTGRHFDQMASLYQNYIGYPITSTQAFPEQGQYMLSKEKKNSVIEDILDDKIIDKVLDRFQGQSCEIQ